MLSHAAVIFTVGAVISAIVLAWYEARLRHHRHPQHPESWPGLRPRVFNKPDHYTEEGRALQRSGRRAILWMILLFFAGFFSQCVAG